MSATSEVITALATLAWPAMVIYVLWSYRKSVSDLFETAKSRGWTLEIGGQKLTMAEVSHQQQSSIEDLQKQVADLKQRIGAPVVAETIVGIVSRAPDQRDSANVLWVDDNPKNNGFFIDLLQRRGYRIDLARSTSEALVSIDRSRYRLIISDMARRDDSKAGITLLNAIRSRRIDTPYVIYCSGRSASWYAKQVLELGAKAITSSATELRAVFDELVPEAVEEAE